MSNGPKTDRQLNGNHGWKADCRLSGSHGPKVDTSYLFGAAASVATARANCGENRQTPSRFTMKSAAENLRVATNSKILASMRGLAGDVSPESEPFLKFNYPALPYQVGSLRK